METYNRLKTNVVMLGHLLVVSVLLYPVVYIEGEQNITKSERLSAAGIENSNPFRCIALSGNRMRNFEALPGIGWDNIQNEAMGQVFERDYTQCRMTEDRKYLIPDTVTIIPLKQSFLDRSAEVIDNMTSYTSFTSRSINTHSSAKVSVIFASVSASFSSDYQSAKLHKMQQNGETSTFRVKAKYLRYRALLQPDTRLHPTFKKRLLKIAEFIQTSDEKMARYLSQLLIRDFGTHAITNCDVGAAIVKEDEIHFKQMEEETDSKESLRISAAYHFRALFGIIKSDAHVDASSIAQKNSLQNYMDKTMQSTVKAYGGPYFKQSNFSISDWLSGIDNNLVTLDRTGEPLFSLITKSNLPELPILIVSQLESFVEKAFNIYYKHNLYRGCTYMKSDNFNAKANVDDNSCHVVKNTEVFGGVFQTCTMQSTDNGDLCANKVVKNSFTGQTSCPVGFNEVKLYDGKLSSSRMDRVCKHFLFLKWSCHDVEHSSEGSYTIIWCASDSNSVTDRYFQFGGVYSTSRANLVTNSYKCPSKYFPIPLGDTKNGSDLTVCLTDDVTATDYGLSFGGMFSCCNVLANVQRRCPHGYMEHLAVTTDEECDIYFCSNFANVGGINQTLPKLQRPPFMKYPPLKHTNRHNAVVIDSNGTWFKNEKAFEKIKNATEDNKLQHIVATFKTASSSMANIINATLDLQTMTTSESSGNDLPLGTVAVISSTTTVGAIVLGTVMVVVFKKRK